MNRNIISLMCLLIAPLVFSCGAVGVCDSLSFHDQIPLMNQKNPHYYAIDDKGAKTKKSELSKKLASELVSRLALTRSEQKVWALHRLQLDATGWWGVVCLLEPGEGEFYYQYQLLPYHPEKCQWGSVTVLSEDLIECQNFFTESWLQDVDGNKTKEIVVRTVEWAIPDDEFEYCQNGISPRWTTRINKFEDGKFLNESFSSSLVDTSKYVLHAEKRIPREIR